MVKQEMLSAKEVARKLGIGVRTWRRLVATGRAPQPRRFNCRLVRWIAAEIDEFAQLTGNAANFATVNRSDCGE